MHTYLTTGMAILSGGLLLLFAGAMMPPGDTEARWQFFFMESSRWLCGTGLVILTIGLWTDRQRYRSSARRRNHSAPTGGSLDEFERWLRADRARRYLSKDDQKRAFAASRPAAPAQDSLTDDR